MGVQPRPPIDAAALQNLKRANARRSSDTRQHRQRPFPQEGEMVRFAEEICLVGRHTIDQVDELVIQLAAFENRVAVIFDPREAKRSIRLRRRPSTIVRLPGGRRMPVCSSMSLESLVKCRS